MKPVSLISSDNLFVLLILVVVQQSDYREFYRNSL